MKTQAGTCLILHSSAVHADFQAKGTKFRSSMVKPAPNSTTTSNWQETPSKQRTSSHALQPATSQLTAHRITTNLLSSFSQRLALATMQNRSVKGHSRFSQATNRPAKDSSCSRTLFIAAVDDEAVYDYALKYWALGAQTQTLQVQIRVGGRSRRALMSLWKLMPRLPKDAHGLPFYSPNNKNWCERPTG